MESTADDQLEDVDETSTFDCPVSTKVDFANTESDEITVQILEVASRKNQHWKVSKIKAYKPS